jgi:hypothetical protein
MRIPVRSDPEASGSSGPVTHAVAAGPPPRAIALEYADDPAPAGPPRRGNLGPGLPAQRTRRGPIRYGPEPTYPAAYYAAAVDSAAPSVPKTREVWPGVGAAPARPTLLARVWRRLRTAAVGSRGNTPTAATAGTEPAYASTGAEPRDLAEHGQRVERIALDRLDESAER